MREHAPIELELAEFAVDVEVRRRFERQARSAVDGHLRERTQFFLLRGKCRIVNSSLTQGGHVFLRCCHCCGFAWHALDSIRVYHRESLPCVGVPTPHARVRVRYG